MVSPYLNVTPLARRCVLPPGELRCICAAVECYKRQTMTDAREQNNTCPYTVCRRASNSTVIVLVVNVATKNRATTSAWLSLLGLKQVWP